SELLKLPAGERAELAMALWDSLSEPEREGELELTPEEAAVLDRRWMEHVQRPESSIPGMKSVGSCWIASESPCQLSPRGRSGSTRNTRAVDMARRIRDRHGRRLAGKTADQMIAFYRAAGQAAVEDAVTATFLRLGKEAQFGAR